MIFARDPMRPQGRPTAAGVMLSLATSLAALSASLAPGAVAQEPVQPFDLVGTVLDDATGQPLVGAYVSMEGADWGSVTDERGRFELPEVFPGTALLNAEQLGYEKLSWRGDIAEGQRLLTLRMTPKPILLEGLRIVADRFESRRRGIPVTSRAFDRKDLATAADWTALDFVARQAGSMWTQCGGDAWGTKCLWIRGRVTEPDVYLDESPLIGGLDVLAQFTPQDLHRVEIYGRGRQIRVYTKAFMERAAEIRLVPIAIF